MPEILLGERAFTVREPSLRRAMEWRKRVSGIVQPILPQLAQLLPGLLPSVTVEIGNDQAADLGLRLAPLLLDGPDLAVDLTLAYWPELEEERDYILDNATSSQMFAAFLEALRSAYPFGQLLALAPAAQINGAGPKQPA